MNMKDQEKLIEICAVIVFAALFLFVGAKSVVDSRITHDIPTGLLASDAFQHQSRVEGIKLLGNYRYEPDYAAAGFTDAVGFYPPLFHHTAAIISYATGLESYDAVMLTVLLFTLLGALAMYYAIRTYNPSIALLSLPLMLFMFGKTPHIGYTFGYWPALTAQAAISLTIWAMISSKKWDAGIIFVALASLAVAMSHTSEFILIIPLGALWLFLELYKTEERKQAIKETLIGGTIFSVLSVYYLIIFYFTWMHVNKGANTLFVAQELENAQLVLGISGFSWFAILIGVGILMTIISIPRIKNRKEIMIFAFSCILLIMSYGHLIGISHWTSQLRFSWPIFLAPLFGLGAYSILKLVKLNNRIIAAGAAGVLIVIFLSASMQPLIGAQMIDKERWDAIQWIKMNTERNDRLMLMYGDAYGSNAVTRNTQRVHASITKNGYTELITNKEIKRMQEMRLLGDVGGVFYAYRKGFLSYGYHFEEEGGKTWEYMPRDICGFDYVLLDKAGANTPFAQYNIILANSMIKTGNVEQVFSNSQTAVLHIKGGDCIEEGTI